MTIGKINITEALKNVEILLREDKTISLQVRTMMELLVVVIDMLVGKLGFNSSNSSIPPSKDTARKRGSKRKKKECPPPDPQKHIGKRGRQAKTKSRNLLERLRDFEGETLRFMTDNLVPFTNNQGENDIRMTKVQQKISGCFRSLEGAQIFCRVRGYLSTCSKHDVSPTEALQMLFDGRLPDFVVKLE